MAVYFTCLAYPVSLAIGEAHDLADSLRTKLREMEGRGLPQRRRNPQSPIENQRFTAIF
jgi:hypothetical protein